MNDFTTFYFNCSEKYIKIPEVFVINKAILILVAGNKDKSMDCEVEESDSKGESAVLEACTDTESKRRN